MIDLGTWLLLGVWSLSAVAVIYAAMTEPPRAPQTDSYFGGDGRCRQCRSPGPCWCRAHKEG